jgi:GTP-binding protein
MGQGGWRVTGATFERSAPDLRGAPAPELPEVAVAGRSNVGKSSLLNALVRQRGLARVSGTPGRTRLLNFFDVDLRSPENEQVPLRIVDLPGYGFAKAHRSVRDAFGPMIEAYLTDRGDTLRVLLILIDARRGPGEMDLELLEFATSVHLPAMIVATKCDKLKKAERGLLARRIADKIGMDRRDVVLTSASSGLGLDDGELAGELGRLVSRGDSEAE